ncbi:DoxX family membrane protein [Paeniglutamicibacter antarcticus]|uniref:DoxX family membrane protein n=1 Tax=Arthrobacter terrae TaxID=2935737 RepID=A0A931CSD1_9MICC|nr:DoxX family membrane protein [Arthrobacter terrae]MBG0741560.1 DoxX family membrane protein [Arthrobacter terrae]
MSIVRLLARPMLASSFILSGLDRLRHADQTAKQLSPVLSTAVAALPFATDEKMLARVIGGTQLGAGVMLAAGKFSRLSALLLTLTSTLNAVVEYRTADSSTSEGRTQRRHQLLKNVSLAGGMLLAAVDTAGKPGLAWRAGHLAEAGKKNTRKQLKHADKAVRRVANEVTGS